MGEYEIEVAKLGAIFGKARIAGVDGDDRPRKDICSSREIGHHIIKWLRVGNKFRDLAEMETEGKPSRGKNQGKSFIIGTKR